MTTHSYLEYALTLLGWIISNGIWNTITATGLFAFPLLIKLVDIWLRAREQGADEGNKGALTVAWMENVVYTALVVIMFTCVPLLNIDITTMKYDTDRSKQCNYSVAQPENTGYSPVINEVSGKTAAVPVWWYFVHTVAKGLTNAATASLPCKPDLRQLRFDVQHIRIFDPVLGQELQDFVQQCYSPSLARLKQRNTGLSQEETDSVGWIGSAYFMTQPGYYDTDHARTPRKAWPYNSDRDAGLTDTGDGGYPTCAQWWGDADVGLKSRTLALVSTSIWQQFQKLSYDRSQYEEAVLRSVVSQRNLEVSQNGRVYPGFGGNVDLTVINGATRTAATVGHSVAALAAFPAFDSIRQSLPMVQAILLMALVICIPVVTVFSAYNVKVVLTLTFAQFALTFLTFWWELARWLDGWMLDILYSSDTHSSWNMVGLQNTQDDIIMMFVMGTMFLVLPAFWMGALSWAGIRLGGAIESATRTGTRDIQQAGAKGGEIVYDALKNVADEAVKAYNKKD
ncbi:conjugal transfer protein TraG [Salmonella enterica subsp. enterica]|nr:conjugal transfer protein TraG [Salmonella enterica subsp. enterica]MIF51128.1 conjugal transfer protein TraG [Salmonella enterica subsp. enterica]